MEWPRLTIAASVGAALRSGDEQVTARRVVLHLSQIGATGGAILTRSRSMQLRRLAARINGHDRDPFARVRVLHRIDAVQSLGSRRMSAIGTPNDSAMRSASSSSVLASMCIPARFTGPGISRSPIHLQVLRCYVRSRIAYCRGAVSFSWGLGFLSMNNESVARRPDYIAFRIREGGRVAAVIAVIRHGSHTDPPWAFWHSSFAPRGELKRVFPNYRRLAIDEFTAKRMITLIAAGSLCQRNLLTGCRF